MKYWSIKRRDIYKIIDNKDLRKSITLSDEWKLLQEESWKTFRSKGEMIIHMPFFFPEQYPPPRFTYRRQNWRPHMRFVQRDGKLKILNVGFY